MSSDEESTDPQEALGGYIGERNEAGERHGIGKATLRNGDLYNGRYKYGQRDGQGTYLFAATKANYEGSYTEGQRHGYGTMTYPDGSKYEGTWDRNIRQGYGVYYYANGDKYDGEWLNDQKHGKGVYEFKQALTKYTGLWNMGTPEGAGTVEYMQMKYKGFFQSGCPIGKGTFVFNKGYELDGIYLVEEDEMTLDSVDKPEKQIRWVATGELALCTNSQEPNEES